MKKLPLLLIPVLLVSAFMTTGCSEENVDPEGKFFISQFYGNTGTYSGAVELANLSSNKINLKNYKITFHRMNGKLNYTLTFDKNTYIEPNGVYVIGNKDNDDFDYHAQCDYILPKDYMFGTGMIQIRDLNDNIIDVVGSDAGYDYGSKKSLLRLPSKYKASTTFSVLDWINVVPSKSNNKIKYLGDLSFPFENENDILNGPKLTEEYVDSHEFSTANYNAATESISYTPGGGLVEVKVTSLGDGDTTRFNYQANLTEELGSDYTNKSTRYYMINTPEVAHPHQTPAIEEEPWGYLAQVRNNEILNSAKKIYCQSVYGKGFTETYGRAIMLIWYTTKEDASWEDYTCLNYQMVNEGYAYLGSSDTSADEMSYNDIAYYDYVSFAYYTAQSKKIKVHGEEDKGYPYCTNLGDNCR